jgi:predicted ATPase
MSRLVLRARALGPLGAVDWTIPPGVSVVVGPNRVGKSTLLRLPEFLCTTIHDGLSEAVKNVFDGVAYLRNYAAPPETPTSVGMAVDDSEWQLTLGIAGGALAPFPEERLTLAGRPHIVRAFGSPKAESDGKSLPIGPRQIPYVCQERIMRAGLLLRDDIPQAEALRDERLREAVSPLSLESATYGAELAATAARSLGYATYRYALAHILRYGSPHSPDTHLSTTGENVFPLLRNWRDRADTEPRYEFVLSTLREAFPHVQRVEFEQAGQTVTMALVDARWSGKRVPISRESTGLLTALLQLCAVASGERGGLVTIDELETSLHPHAIRVLIAAFRRWAREQDLRVVLATQSETVLDQFRDEPAQVFVIEPRQDSSPKPLTDLFSQEWLSQFSLGDLFAHLEFGGNGPLPPA